MYPAYGVAAIPVDTDMVLADAAQLAAQGARHFAFVDAEFFNTRRHALNAMEAVADRLGPVTFEMTTRFDHILEFEAEINQMTGLGLRVITSALEFPSERVLQVFDKGIDVPGIKKAIRAAKAAGVELRPTFITFTPWVTLAEIQALEDFLDETGIAGWVDHTARQTRLLARLLELDVPLAAVGGFRYGQLVACCVSLEKGDRLYAKYAGFDYDTLGTRSGAYFAVVRLPPPRRHQLPSHRPPARPRCLHCRGRHQHSTPPRRVREPVT